MDLFVNPKLSAPEQVRPIDAHIGKLLIDAGKLNANDVKRIVALQKEQGLRFGEAALSLRLVDSKDILRALSVQFEYPYAPADSGLHRDLVMATQPFGARAEALRALRSQLMLRWFGGRRKLLTVTSARRGEGCSEVAANLAIAYAQLGEKTLLIDTDMRTPGLHKLFSFKEGVGLSNLLAGRGSLFEAVEYVDPINGLAVLCTGAQPPNPQELLSRAAFVSLLTEASETYDVIILDTAPALESADAQIVAAVTGGALVVARRNQTRSRDLQRVGDQFVPAGVTVVGTVMVD
jgi:chain length determinant protein tyrosine kinase EpsG